MLEIIPPSRLMPCLRIIVGAILIAGSLHPAAMRGWGQSLDVSERTIGQRAESPLSAQTTDVQIGDLIPLDQARLIGKTRSTYRRWQPDMQPIEKPTADLERFETVIRPIVTDGCCDCHGESVQEGSFRIDTLDPDLIQGQDLHWWIDVYEAVANEEMPPADAGTLSDEDRGRFVHWLSTELQLASKAKRNQEHAESLRRMTRYEFNYALQDLLGLPYDFASDLPPESHSHDGFENDAETLHMSAPQFAEYHRLSRAALDRAVVTGKRPKPIYWGVTMAQASAKHWAKMQRDLEDAKINHQDDPEELERALERIRSRSSAKRSQTHYRNNITGSTARANWSYRGARYAWEPTRSHPEIPALDSESSKVVAWIPAQQRLTVELGDRVPDEGTLRVRVRASAAPDAIRPPSLRLEFGWQASNNSSASVEVGQDQVIDAPAERPEFYQWDIPLSEIYPRNPMRGSARLGETPNPSEFIRLVNSSLPIGNDPSFGGIEIDYVEVSAPVYDRWPPTSHQRIFIPSKHPPESLEYAREVLRHFMSRAWRRPIRESEIEQKLKLFQRIRHHTNDFQDAMVETLATVLASPSFLYVPGLSAAITESADQNSGGQNSGGSASNSSVSGDVASSLSSWDLATRLSLFLWCSIPDQTLHDLARSGQLQDPEIIAGQVRRMLADPRSKRFATHFVRGWLGTHALDHLQVNAKTFPQFDASLKRAVQEEPIEFFREVLEHNHSIMDFVHSDYAVANERLARHYGIPNVYGNHFRPVALSPQHHRGGLLAQAGLLAMNSDGKDSHPLKRGIWVLERLLNDPPPPPPPAVPKIDLADPRIAQMTLKERLEDHRNQPACFSCHAKIDPWGIALENFDAVGQWRTEIRGREVDATSQLFNDQTIDGIEGLKRFLLLNRQDQFARALTHKMLTFALGRTLSFADRSSVDEITARLRQQDDGLATLVTCIATSDAFRRP